MGFKESTVENQLRRLLQQAIGLLSMKFGHPLPNMDNLDDIGTFLHDVAGKAQAESRIYGESDVDNINDE